MAVMSIRPKACNVMHNGLHELAVSYDGGTTWALTTRRGEIPCDMDDWFGVYDWNGQRPVARANASATADKASDVSEPVNPKSFAVSAIAQGRDEGGE